MRFAITGVDRYLGVFEAFIRAGWQPVKLFTVLTGLNERESNHGMIALAKQYGAHVQMSEMTTDDLRQLERYGCDALVVASYKWHIGDWTPYIKYAVNFHCSPLPEARGPYPTVRAILEQRSSWAVTCHKVAPKFDSGDILAIQNFPMAADECHESLDLKVQIAASRLAKNVAMNFVDLWQSAKPQGPGTYWPRWKKSDQEIDFNQPVDAIMRHIRAYGLLESFACLGDRWLSIHRAVGWIESGAPAPGTIAHINNRTIVVAALDGYIALIEWTFAGDDVVAQLSRKNVS